MDFRVFDFDLLHFRQAWDLQKEIFSRVKNGALTHGLIFCRHYPVITLGRLAKRENILVASEELQRRNINTYNIERGGDVTYHGPGQLTVYPVFNLNLLKKDIHWFLRRLEDLVVDCLLGFGAFSYKREGLTGVWCKNGKIASLGIAIKNWITFHGLSINIKSGDLENFRLIRPCGLDIQMASLEQAAGRPIDIDILKKDLAEKLRRNL